MVRTIFQLLWDGLWQAVRQHPVRSSIVALVIVLLAAFAFAIHLFGWDWTGFNGGFSQITSTSIAHGTTTVTVQPPVKTFWDWLQLLIVPFMLAVGGFWLNNLQKSREVASAKEQAKIEKKKAKKRARAEREIALDNQREAALQAYIDRISELLLHERLSEADDFKADADGTAEFDDLVAYVKALKGVRKIARVRTLTVLSRLDAERKGSVLQFLYESKLLNKDAPIVALDGADLSGADLFQADLLKANLHGANLRGADLSGANLRGADLGRASLPRTKLFGAKLNEADLFRAKLFGANLERADLSKANLSHANLGKANLRGTYLKGANLNCAMLGNADLRRVDLSEANLSEAYVLDDSLHKVLITLEQLAEAKSLKGATMPDGSTHP